jgi:hypothetical protein
MLKLGIIASVTSVVAAIALAAFAPSPVDAADACSHAKFETKMVADACKKGGQKEAKAVMKAFMKEKKLKSCNQCHSKLAPSYDLKADGLAQFKKAGGA